MFLVAIFSNSEVNISIFPDLQTLEPMSKNSLHPSRLQLNKKKSAGNLSNRFDEKILESVLSSERRNLNLSSDSVSEKGVACTACPRNCTRKTLTLCWSLCRMRTITHIPSRALVRDSRPLLLSSSGTGLLC